ncbi:protein phosphatase 2C domain-containing protein [Paenibacillus physcomitrellae]|uniref:PPM-type phosphatase domain-containing protein n=1 Tax=Paenibacillus physcomitrellae TaxID=1619311 RepID=A0ABQ1G8I7_9BACL|nr:protein phosphatase 2C domain-containing protein [Paenibacillus physcomitrellae]GGA38770.1 hypothetical protein GCM10010917_25000 [Paenibacillus physcomitrellae]
MRMTPRGIGKGGQGPHSELFMWLSSQDTVQPVTSWSDGGLTCRYGYSPSSESSSYGEPGQDFGAVAVHGNSVRFVLCDGVSLSYRGDFGAKLLGEGLFEWLREPPGMEIEPAVRLLEALSFKAEQALDCLELPAGLPPMLRDVLLEKRSQGTAAMFTCGYLVRPTPEQEGELWLMWQGDLRIRLWRDEQEQRPLPETSFRTEERWTSMSSARQSRLQRSKTAAQYPHMVHLPIPSREKGGLLLYTDGLQSLDKAGLPLSGCELTDALRGGAAGWLEDDASLLEVSWNGVEPDF